MNNYILCVLVCPHLQVDDTSLTKNFYADRCGRCRSFSYCRAGHKQECGASGEQRINVKWAMGEGLLVMEEEPGTEELDDQEDTRSMEVLSPPENMFPHRGSSDTCKLGSKTYCPGEVLFR